MKTIAVLLLMIIPRICLAQVDPFQQLRYDENYAYLAKDTSTNWYNRLKFNPISKDKATYFSFGGDVRYQYFHFNNEHWGATPEDNDGFVLTRYLWHIDFHSGKHFRTFVQLQSSLASGEVETPSPVDQNTLDLHQAFIDYSNALSTGENLTVRIGRQELLYGSQRLVAVREAPNNRQAFDAVKFIYATKNSRIDLFYSCYVPARPNIFDDSFNNETLFWGFYGVFTKIPIVKNVDLYYFGIYKKNIVFDDGKGIETRHSVGTRIWQSTPTWRYDLEGVYQFGNFATSNIMAWVMSANISYTFYQTRLKLQIGSKTEVVSGDKKQGDGRLNTFNSLFPRGAYFGLAALIGPYNLIDAHPYIQLKLTKKLVFTEDYDMFWRMSRNDGLYAVNGKILYSSKSGNSKQIGSQLGSALEYNPNKYLYFRQELTWFGAGKFLKEAGPGKNILMIGSTITVKF